MVLLLTLLLTYHTVGGEHVPLSLPASAHGWVPQEEEYPWVVGVHKKEYGADNFRHICGGSLISSLHAISAAHCFWNRGDEVPLNDYRLSAGNFHRDLTKDYGVQKIEVDDIIFHNRYRGYDVNYAYDIVIVVLKQEAMLKSDVSPISIDWSSEFEDTKLQGYSGTVVGWGFTERDEPSETRVAVNLPFVDFDACYQAVPRQFRRSLTPDKFCAGHRNGTAVCPGDSGGGLAFYDSMNYTWYLRGIVSIGVQPKGSSKCEVSQYSAFTSISHYRTWLQKKLSELQQPTMSTIPDDLTTLVTY